MIKKVSFSLICLMAAILGFWLSLSLREDFKTVDEESFRWNDFDGQVLIINYFAEWCAPCLKEIPELNAFHEYTIEQDDVSLFAVNFDNLNDTDLKGLQKKYEMTFNMISGIPKNAPYGMPKALPATFIIGPDGKLIKQLNGEQTNQGLQDVVNQLRQLQIF